MRRNKMIRVFCAVFSVVLLLSMAACSSGTGTDKGGQTTQAPSGEKVKLSFWDYHPNEQKDFMAKLPVEYQKINPNVEITYSNFPQDDYMGSKLTTAFASNAGPDIFFMSAGDFLKYANSGIALDLTPYFTDAIRADFLESAIENVTVNGKIMGIPIELELMGLFYNKDMLAAANIQPPKTWSELLEATKKLTTDKVAGLIIEPSAGYYQNFTWYPFVWMGGGDPVDMKNKKGTFEGPAVENALKLWADLIKAGAPAKLSIPGTWDISLLGTGQAAMQLSGTWTIADIENKYPDVNIGVAPYPIPDGGKPATCAGGWKFMVNSRSRHADAAAKFAMWAFAENVELPLEWCTVVKFAYSPRKSVVEAGKDIFGKGLRKVFTDEIYPTAIAEPRYPAEIVNAIGAALQDVMFKNADPKEAAKKANDTINEFLKTFEGSM